MKHYPPEFKADAVALHRSWPGATIKSVAADLGVNTETLMDAMDASTQHPDAGEAARSLTGQVEAGPGGAMTDEVGVITGDLTLTTRLDDDGQAHFAVQYTQADEWYTLTGSPRPLPPTASTPCTPAPWKPSARAARPKHQRPRRSSGSASAPWSWQLPHPHASRHPAMRSTSVGGAHLGSSGGRGKPSRGQREVGRWRLW
ncbi:transposase [Streptomyces sp. NPDC001205]